METREITVYEFDELTDRAKDTARQWYRDASAHDEFWDSVYEDADRVARILGIALKVKHKNNPKAPDVPTIWFTGFSSQGDGASFEGYYSYSLDVVKRLAEYAPKDMDLLAIAKTLEQAQEKHGNQVTARIEQSGRYCHEMTMRIEVFVGDDDADSETEETIKEAMRDFARWIYKQLEKEHEYLNSNETVDDNIRANEYKFLENGELAD